MNIERRVKPRPVSIETREDGVKTLSGYAAVFYNSSDAGTQYELWEGCRERIAPGAFSRAIAEGQDVACLFNHDSDHLMGRTSNKTCRLSVDGVGLRYETDLPDTVTARDCAALVSRGDITGSSFSFCTRSVEWSKEEDGTEIRLLKDVDLMDVGPVTYPAYTATSTSARDEQASLEAERKEHEKLEAESRARKQREADAVDVVRMRMKLQETV